MAGPIGALEAALYSKLNVASVVGAGLASAVYNSLAKQGAVLPYVIYQWQGGGFENDHSTDSLNLVYTVKALATDVVKADTIDAACSALLHKGSVTVAGWSNNFWLRREEHIAYPEIDATGVPVFHRGAMYRIRLEAG